MTWISIDPRPTRSRIATALSVASLVGAFGIATHAGATEEKPVVRTRLVIESELFDDLGARKADVEAAIARYLAKAADKHFKFLRWYPVEPEEPEPERVDAELELRLFERAANGRAIHLAYRARVGGEELLTPELPQDLELYDVWATKPTQAEEYLKLIAALEACIDGRHEKCADSGFGHGDLRDRLMTHFLSQIPLARDAELVPTPEQRSIVLPLRWANLRARSDGSMLRVSLHGRLLLEGDAASATGDVETHDATGVTANEMTRESATEADLPADFTSPAGTSSQGGHIHLTPAGEFNQGDLRGMTQCTVAIFSYPPIAIGETSPEKWDERIPNALHRDNLERLEVFMHRYELDPRPPGPPASGPSDPGLDVEFDEG